MPSGTPEVDNYNGDTCKLIGGDVRLGDRCTFTCPRTQDYTLVGSSCNTWQDCLPDPPRWSPGCAFTCEDKTCPAFPGGSGYESDCVGAALTAQGPACTLACDSCHAGDVVKVACLPPAGVDVPGGGPNPAAWNDTEASLSCTPVTCPAIPSGPGRSSTCSLGETACGGTCVVTCDDCFSGVVETITCQKGGWDKPVPACSPEPVCGSVDNTGSYRSTCHEVDVPCGGGCTLMCPSCHTGSNVTRTCTAGGAWDGTGIPLCNQERCPKIPSAGPVISSCDNVEIPCGLNCSLDCETCYHADPRTITCGMGVYPPYDMPTCVRKVCPPIAVGAGAVTTCAANGTLCSESCTTECDACYTSSGTVSHICGGGGWEIATPPTCTLRTCPARASTTKYTSSCSGEDAGCGTNCTEVCDECFNGGASVLQCSNAGWIGESPVCLRKTCTLAASPANTACNAQCGEVCTVACPSCTSGGAVPRRCTPTGWNTTDLPACTLDVCVPIVALPYLSTCAEGSTNCSDSCSLSCPQCFFGSDVTHTCGPSGWLSSGVPACGSRLACPEVTGGNFSGCEDRSCGSTCTLKCDACYEDATVERECSHVLGAPEALWNTSDTPACILRTCPPIVPSVGLLSNCSDESVGCGGTCTVTCDECGNSASDSTALCTPSGWVYDGPEEPTCTVKMCSMVPAGLVFNGCPATPCGANCTMDCSGGQVGPTVVRTCEGDVWSSTATPVCLTCEGIDGCEAVNVACVHQDGNTTNSTCATCDTGRYLIPGPPDLCAVCTPGCAACSAAGLSTADACALCAEEEGFHLALDGSTCTNTCTATQYVDTNSSVLQCAECTAGCAACAGAGLSLTSSTCGSCDLPAGAVPSLTGEACVFECPGGQYKDNACKACTAVEGCAVELSCTSANASTCSTCAGGRTRVPGLHDHCAEIVYVADVSPANSSQVGKPRSVVLTFSTDVVQHALMESLFSVFTDVPGEGVHEVEGSYVWPRGDREVEFVYDFEAVTLHRVVVEAAVTFNYDVLRFDSNFFSLGLVRATSPYGGTVDVPLTTKIVVIFDEAMDRDSVASEFHVFGPEGRDYKPLLTAGDWTAQETLLEFQPSDVLQEGTVYTLSFSASMQSAAGNKLGRLFEVSFTTALTHLAVVDSFPLAVATYSRLTHAEVLFTKEPNVTSVEKYFSLTEVGVPGDIPFAVSTNGSAARFEFAPLAKSTSYEFTLARGMEPLRGLPLEAPFSWTVAVDPVRIVAFEPEIISVKKKVDLVFAIAGKLSSVTHCVFDDERVPAEWDVLTSTATCEAPRRTLPGETIVTVVDARGIQSAEANGAVILYSACPPGFFQANKSTDGCERCPVNSYNNGSSTVACLECGFARHTTSDGMDNESSCLCDEGYHGPPGGACDVCPEGGRCLGEYSSPVALENYYRAQDGSFVVCPIGAECSGGEAQPEALPGFFPSGSNEFVACEPKFVCEEGGKCAEGYTSRLCVECAPGFYRVGGLCEACPTNQRIRVVWFALGSIAAAVAFLAVAKLFMKVTDTEEDVKKGAQRLVARGRSLFDIGAIILGYLQVVAILASFKLQWPATVVHFFNAISLFNFNLDLLAAECSQRVTYSTKWAFMMFIPLFFLMLFVVMALALRTLRIVVPRTPLVSLDHVIGASCFFLTFAHIPIGVKVLEVFDCNSLDGREPALDADPSFPCSGQAYDSLLGAAVVMFFVYVLGIPALLAAALVRSRKSLEDSTTVTRFGMLYKKYWKEYYYWEIMAMLRKFSVAATTLFFNRVPMLQGLIAILILVLSMVLQMRTDPFEKMVNNMAEMCVGVSLVLVLLFGVAFLNLEEDASSAMVTGLAVLLILVVVLSTVVVIAIAVASLFVPEDWHTRSMDSRELARGVRHLDDAQFNRVMQTYTDCHKAEAPLDQEAEDTAAVGADGGKDSVPLDDVRSPSVTPTQDDAQDVVLPLSSPQFPARGSQERTPNPLQAHPSTPTPLQAQASTPTPLQAQASTPTPLQAQAVPLRAPPQMPEGGGTTPFPPEMNSGGSVGAYPPAIDSGGGGVGVLPPQFDSSNGQ